MIEKSDFTKVVRDGETRAFKEFTLLIEPLGFVPTLKRLWVRLNPHTADFVHLHRNGISYGAPYNYQVSFRVHFGIRVLNDNQDWFALNGPTSDPGIARAGRYHLSFNAKSWSQYDRCVTDLVRFVTTEGEPWFARFRVIRNLCDPRYSPLTERETQVLKQAISGDANPENTAISYKCLGIKHPAMPPRSKRT